MGNNCEREMVNRTEDMVGLAWGGSLGTSRRAECYLSESQMVAQHLASQACAEGDEKRLSKMKARKNFGS